MLPKIGITTVLQTNPRNGAPITTVANTYIHAVSHTGGLPFLLPVLTEEETLELYVKEMDGFIFSGGIDISPSCYEENPHALLGETSQLLDRCQIPLMQKVIAARKPFLAICRGNQVLNVACGGTLYQDNSLHSGETFKHMQATDRGDASHLVYFEPDNTFHDLFGDTVMTNSYHHQSVKDLGKGLRICGRANDGIIEAIELEDYPCGLGIQWHPEMMFLVEDSMRPLFEALTKAACK